ncbi:hypothetical protein [Actinoplanes sp. N902-109]|uniref:hypothetical protein n=1 Tax=Actinoplanes sp. (strain N902-109) TaxID=649831 RepID=UPI0003295B54|nr:hypothetical protein [Actinoplanes sp. N902-109]AGL19540.1 hypothetical protein L083_6030 [Actinoplanes sp. N902-109]
MRIKKQHGRRTTAALAAVTLVAAAVVLGAGGAALADDGNGAPPVKPDTAADRARLADENAARQVGDLATAHGALGLYRDGGKYVVVLPRTSGKAALTTADLTARGMNARVAASARTSAEVAAMTTAIKQRTWNATANKYAYGFYFDVRRDAMVVGTDAPADVMAPLLRSYPGKIVTESGPTRRDARLDDGPPHWGGASINDVGSTPDCSSGFVVQNSAGTRFMATAAHCFGLGTAVKSTGGGGSFGTVVSRGPFPTWDQELLGGASYGSYIYTGGSAGVGTHVGSANDPVVGFTGYCRSGQTTFEQCGSTVTSLSGSFCDASGCTPSLIVYSGGGTSAGGDSGAPYYLPGTNVAIRGLHIARSGTTMYAERYNSIAAHFGVSIVT